jgi:hypothetical protein
VTQELASTDPEPSTASAVVPESPGTQEPAASDPEPSTASAVAPESPATQEPAASTASAVVPASMDPEPSTAPASPVTQSATRMHAALLKALLTAKTDAQTNKTKAEALQYELTTTKALLSVEQEKVKIVEDEKLMIAEQEEKMKAAEAKKQKTALTLANVSFLSNQLSRPVKTTRVSSLRFPRIEELTGENITALGHIAEALFGEKGLAVEKGNNVFLVGEVTEDDPAKHMKEQIQSIKSIYFGEDSKFVCQTQLTDTQIMTPLADGKPPKVVWKTGWDEDELALVKAHGLSAYNHAKKRKAEQKEQTQEKKQKREANSTSVAEFLERGGISQSLMTMPNPTKESEGENDEESDDTCQTPLKHESEESEGESDDTCQTPLAKRGREESDEESDDIYQTPPKKACTSYFD